MPNDIIIRNVRVQIGDLSKAVDRTAIHAAMAKRYLEIVRGTFGPAGVNRANEWPALSPSYAKKVKPPVPTLYRKGNLFASISASADAQAGHVVCDSDIGIYHQDGTARMPSRRFFPFYRNGDPTPYAQSEMERVAVEAAKNV